MSQALGCLLTWVLLREENRGIVIGASTTLLSALLDITLHEVLGIGFQYLVDVVQKIIELGLQSICAIALLAGIGFVRRAGFTLRNASLFLGSLSHE